LIFDLKELYKCYTVPFSLYLKTLSKLKITLKTQILNTSIYFLICIDKLSFVTCITLLQQSSYRDMGIREFGTRVRT